MTENYVHWIYIRIAATLTNKKMLIDHFVRSAALLKVVMQMAFQ